MRKVVLPVLFLVYLGTLIFVSWWPFNFQAAGGHLAFIEWPPFRLLLPAYWAGGKINALKVVTFVPFGILMAATPVTSSGKIGVLWRSLAIGASLSLLIHIGWVFLPNRSISASGVVLNLIGVAAGASPICFHFLSRRALGILTLVYCAFFLVAATWPWNFSLRAATPSRLLPRIEVLPAHGKLALFSTKDEALNALMTVPLGLFAVSYLLRKTTAARSLIAAGLLGISCSVIVETLQCFLPYRTPSLSDITLNSLGAIAGGIAAYYLERWWGRHPRSAAASA